MYIALRHAVAVLSCSNTHSCPPARDPHLLGLDRYVLKALTARAPAWRYAVVFKRLLNWSLPVTLPARWLDLLFAYALGFKPLPRAPAA